MNNNIPLCSIVMLRQDLTLHGIGLFHRGKTCENETFLNGVLIWRTYERELHVVVTNEFGDLFVGKVMLIVIVVPGNCAFRDCSLYLVVLVIG